jgi:hypothetical protein
MFIESRERVVPRIRQGISEQGIMMTIFFTSTGLLVLEALPKGMKFNQDYFIQAVLPGLSNESSEFHAGRVSRSFQFTWTIQCVAMVTKFRGNLTKEASNELHVHRILEI